MRLAAYLLATDQSESEFARRTGEVISPALPQRTIGRIKNMEVSCRIDIADVIVRTSQRYPAPDGATVTFEDLVPLAEDHAA